MVSAKAKSYWTVILLTVSIFCCYLSFGLKENCIFTTANQTKMFTVLFLGYSQQWTWEHSLIMITWVINFICLNMHGVDSARSYHSKAKESLSSVKSPSDIKTPSLNLGFSHACAVPDSYLIGEKKKVHTQSHACAVCLSLQAKLLHLFVRLHAFFRHPKVAWCQGRA